MGNKVSRHRLNAAEERHQQREREFNATLNRISAKQEERDKQIASLITETQKHAKREEKFNEQISSLRTENQKVQEQKEREFNNKLLSSKAEQEKKFNAQMDSLKSENQKKLDSTLRTEREKNEELLKKERQEREKKLEELKTKQEAFQKKQLDEMKKMEKSKLLEHSLQLKLHYPQLQKPCDDYYAAWCELRDQEDELKSQVLKEAEQLQNFEQENNDVDALRVVLYSPTGEGKSLLGNRLAGDDSEEGDEGPFVPSDGVESETQAIKKEFIPKGTRYNYALSLTDQPGSSDSTGRDREHANNLVTYLRGIEYIHAIVLVKNFQDVRVNNAYQNMLKSLENLLGRGVWKHIIVVLTRVEGPKAKLAPEYATKFTEKLRDVLKLTTEEAPFPVICLSNFGGYLEPIQKLINDVVPSLGKFSCDKLHSPLEKLQVELSLRTRKTEEAHAKWFEANQNLGQLRKSIVATEQQLKSLDNSFVPTFAEK